MRGKPHHLFLVHQAAGNIPAYAGKTSSQDFKSKTQTEHPRVCGENRSAPRTPRRALRNIPAYAGKTRGVWGGVGLGWGTSPRMRGKPHEHARRPAKPGNIPVYAGKTQLPNLTAGLSEEHPRVCGENSERDIQDSGKAGTSPRMRGKRLLLGGVGSGEVNIPAYAGKTYSPSFSSELI